MFALSSSTAPSLDVGALRIWAWAVLLTVAAIVAKKVLDWITAQWLERNAAALRTWLREKFFQVFLLRSHPNSSLAVGLARRVGAWLGRLPRISADAVEVLDDAAKKHGARQVVACALGILWGAYTEARLHDRTLQLGMWLRLIGVATISLGLQAMTVGQPWAVTDIALGVTMAISGHYLGALRFRRRLWVALLGIGPVAIALGARFDHAESVSVIGIAILTTLVIGSAFAAIASTAAALEIMGASWHPRERGARRGLLRSRMFLIWLAMRCCGLGCLFYAVANALQAFTIAPTFAMQATHLLIAVLLCLAAGESWHPAGAYRRLMRPAWAGPTRPYGTGDRPQPRLRQHPAPPAAVARRRRPGVQKGQHLATDRRPLPPPGAGRRMAG
ncbi:MAG: hypothetical protein ACRDZM_02495 [Acidimicrobiia bacterium]